MAVAQSTVKAQVIDMLNNALQLEHAARIQYLAHAELVSGINAEPVIARLREIASDEEKHEAIFRELLGDYLDAEPTMAVAETHKASTTDQILGVNLKDEKTAIEFYKQIYNLICENKKNSLLISRH